MLVNQVENAYLCSIITAKMKEETFKIQSYFKGELARLYSPSLTENAARVKLMRWISMQPRLVDDLHSVGYTDSTRILTPLMVRLIVEAIGEP